MEYLIIMAIFIAPIVVGIIYYAIKVRTYYNYYHEYDGPDQVSKYYKIRLYTNKRIKSNRNEYWQYSDNNFKTQMDFEKLMEKLNRKKSIKHLKFLRIYYRNYSQYKETLRLFKIPY